MNTKANPLLALEALGQSVWLDFISREILKNGELARQICDDGVRGVTSNPAIFEKAIARSDDYDTAIAALIAEGKAANAIYEALVLDDVRAAADLLRPVYDASHQLDGYVSLEVSPHLAHDTEATVNEAQSLWRRTARPNLMIKVPATLAGLPAIRRLIAQGINVNVTLLFGIGRYRQVAAAYMEGLEDRRKAGLPLSGIASVASFFVSRIDTLVDSRLDRMAAVQAQSFRGKTAVACARLAYQAYLEIIAERRWQELASRGARPQRLLWASTSTKDPTYSDVKYVDTLIGPDTVNTMPPATLAAYRDHGKPAQRLGDDLATVRALPSRLAALGLDLEAVADELEEEGVQKFIEPFDHLMGTIADKTRSLSEQQEQA